MMHLAIFTVCLGTTVFAQSPSFGGCPTVPAQTEFNITAYMGTWYEHYVFPTHFEKGSCARAHYTLQDNGHIEVYNRGIENSTEFSVVGDAYCPDNTHPAQLLVRFAAGTPYGKYWVIDTDYDTYTMIYSCEAILGVAHIEFAWIMARDQTLDPALKERLMKELADYGVDVRKFKQTHQEDCPP